MEEERRLYEAEQEARERPIREATEQLTATHRKLHAMEKAQISSRADEQVYVDPVTIAMGTIPQAQADAYNAQQASLFRQNNPDFYPSEKNVQAIVDYLKRNRIEIVSALILEKAYERLSQFGLLEERPAPVEVVEPVEETQPVVVERQPERFIGIDLSTGTEREYTAYEVDRMSSDEYRRVFRVTKASLELPIRNW
jgi:hypothetical protein